jgi:hypothetical protein
MTKQGVENNGKQNKQDEKRTVIEGVSKARAAVETSSP